MPQDIYNADSLLNEIAAEADRLGLSYSNNPDILTEPVDAIDAMLEHLCPDPTAQRVREEPKQEWLEHEPVSTDDQPDDPEELQMAQDTLEFFMKFDKPDMRHFEPEFRAFLHCEDYSYSEKTIQHLIASVLGLD